MYLYIISIVGTDVLVILINVLLNLSTNTVSIFNIFFVTIISTVLVIAIDGFFATVIRHCLPNKMFSHRVKFFYVKKSEAKIYEKFGVKKWKDDVLELGVFTSFSKKRIEKPDNREYVERFILECNYGAALHFVGVFDGLFLFWIFPSIYHLGYILPVFIVNAILNLLPFMILRYNTERLQRLRIVLEKKEMRLQNEK